MDIDVLARSSQQRQSVAECDQNAWSAEPKPNTQTHTSVTLLSARLPRDPMRSLRGLIRLNCDPVTRCQAQAQQIVASLVVLHSVQQTGG